MLAVGQRGRHSLLNTRPLILVLSIFYVRCIVLVAAVPKFDINLDDPPEQRWVGVASYYRDDIVSMLDTLIPVVNTNYGDKQDSWIDDVDFDPEYAAELQGFVNVIDHPSVSVARLKWLNMLYEMQSPYAYACSGVLWAMTNGTVMAGRNLDDFSEDPMIDWPALTFNVDFYKSGRLLVTQTQFPGNIIAHTAMRHPDQKGFGGWSFSQNSRSPNEWQENLAAAGQGGKVFGLAVRRILETTPDFATALSQVYATKYMAPQYFIMSGSGPLEGAVLTIDRLGEHDVDSPPIQRLGNSSGDWHLVQTNDDLLSEAADPRRPLANHLLRSQSRDIAMRDDNLMQFMHTTMVLNSGTIFSTVMVPKSGLYKTALPAEPPSVIDGSAASQSILMQGPGATPAADYDFMSLSQSSAEPLMSRFSSQQNRTPSRVGHSTRFLDLPAKPFVSRFMSQQKGASSRVRRPRRFLDLRTNKKRRAGGASPSVLDEVSMMQTSWKLDAGTDL